MLEERGFGVGFGIDYDRPSPMEKNTTPTNMSLAKAAVENLRCLCNNDMAGFFSGMSVLKRTVRQYLSHEAAGLL